MDLAVKELSVGEHRVKLSLWDTAGQERFRAITRQYYRAMHAVIFGERARQPAADGWHRRPMRILRPGAASPPTTALTRPLPRSVRRDQARHL